MWQRQKDSSLKPVGYASGFLADTDKKYAIYELELFAEVWGLEQFRLHMYSRPIELLTDHQALEPQMKETDQMKDIGYHNI